MLKSFTKIRKTPGYKFSIERRCERLGIPIRKTKYHKFVDEKYLKLLFLKLTCSDMYWKISDWIDKFDDDLREYLYAEMFDMRYEELSKFIIRKELI
ncbi:MAG: hypothetical protein K9L99_05850 [Candidatus Omnitrophica bacterium]|nr:hypothetical protein [Candidatus Omnitrophota bacterium]